MVADRVRNVEQAYREASEWLSDAEKERIARLLKQAKGGSSHSLVLAEEAMGVVPATTPPQPSPPTRTETTRSETVATTGRDPWKVFGAWVSAVAFGIAGVWGGYALYLSQEGSGVQDAFATQGFLISDETARQLASAETATTLNVPVTFPGTGENTTCTVEVKPVYNAYNSVSPDYTVSGCKPYTITFSNVDTTPMYRVETPN